MGQEQSGPHLVEPVLDLQLQMLIQLLVEQSDENRVPITLNVPGALVCGYLVSASAWRTRWVERIGSMTGPGAEHLSFFPDRILNAVDEVLKEEGEERPDMLPRWIHLLDVRIVTGAMNTVADVPLWRGRLADVAGWSIGLPE